MDGVRQTEVHRQREGRLRGPNRLRADGFVRVGRDGPTASGHLVALSGRTRTMLLGVVGFRAASEATFPLSPPQRSVADVLASCWERMPEAGRQIVTTR